MNIACIICSDLFTPGASIYITPCGHLFHYACLLQWFDRAKTCPQCRNKVSERTIIRVFPNISSMEGISEDAVTLQSRIDNLHLQVKMKEKDAKVYKEKVNRLNDQNASLRAEIRELEQKERVTQSAMNALKDQISFFKQKAKQNDKYFDEIGRLKGKLKEVENVQMVIDGTRDQVRDMLRHNNDPEALTLLVHTLKKALIDADRKKRDLEKSIKQSQNDSNEYRKRSASLEEVVRKLKCEIESLTKNSENSRLSYSPRSAARSHQTVTKSPFSIATNASPSLPEKVKQIKDSESPYLRIKSSSVGLDFQYPKERSRGLSHSTPYNSKPAFKIADAPPPPQPVRNCEFGYDGMGGHSKDDLFPSPRPPPPKSLKRHRSASTVSSAKFKKLSPSAGNLNRFLDKR